MRRTQYYRSSFAQDPHAPGRPGAGLRPVRASCGLREHEALFVVEKGGVRGLDRQTKRETEEVDVHRWYLQYSAQSVCSEYIWREYAVLVHFRPSSPFIPPLVHSCDMACSILFQLPDLLT